MLNMKMKEEAPEPKKVAWCKKCRLKYQSEEQKYEGWGLCTACCSQQVRAIKAGIYH